MEIKKRLERFQRAELRIQRSRKMTLENLRSSEAHGLRKRSGQANVCTVIKQFARVASAFCLDYK